MKFVKSVYEGAHFAACHTQHPVLELGGGQVLGATCLTPKPGYDIYVGLDRGVSPGGEIDPWEAGYTSVLNVVHLITDGSVPSDVVRFKAMVTWLVAQLAEGKRVHLGCIGGHGRTGLLLAAMVKEATGNEDAIRWVRKHYCKSAVETTIQVDFLHTHYGVKTAPSSKASYHNHDLIAPHSWQSDSVDAGYKGKTVITPFQHRSFWGTAIGTIDKRNR